MIRTANTRREPAGLVCRINGTVYDVLDSAPAVVNDYNYPYGSSFGTPTKDAKFFYRNARINNNYRNRTIWCKTNGPGWPKTTAGIDLNSDGDYLDAGKYPPCPYSCTMGGTTIPPVGNVAQTCDPGTTVSGAPYAYSPVGCDANPAVYQFTWGGAPPSCVGTIGVECLGCNRSSTVLTRNANCSITNVWCVEPPELLRPP